jgi:hypothetical protein
VRGAETFWQREQRKAKGEMGEVKDFHPFTAMSSGESLLNLIPLPLTPVPLGSLQELLRDPRPRSKLLPKEQAK